MRSSLWLLLLLLSTAAQARTLAVYVDGTLPGIADGAPIIAGLMAGQQVAGWTFSPGDPHAALAANRVQWTITLLPFAGDTAQRIGRLLARRQDLFGRYRYIRVEVRVFLDGLYQTTSFATGEVQGGADDPKLKGLVQEITGPLLTIGLEPQHAP